MHTKAIKKLLDSGMPGNGLEWWTVNEYLHDNMFCPLGINPAHS